MNTQDYTSLTQEQILKLLEQSQATNAQLLEVIEQLRSQLDKLQRMVFGQKTERHNKKQDKNKNKPEKTSSLKPKSNSNQANGRKK